ncbi:MAG: hypothetical protein QOE55_5333, partial [Acidobacteriaceae bacterium]|nr:hypothetical protein [Acidobacteriaceae bacterium]
LSRKGMPQPASGELPVKESFREAAAREATRETSREVLGEPAPFTLAPQPVLVDEIAQSAQSTPPPMMPAVHIDFDEPFEEEYARLIPSKPDLARETMSSARGAESAHRNEADAHLENLDIPAFLRRPVN